MTSKTDHLDKTQAHWKRRSEPAWDRFQFNQPYEKGLKRLRGEILGKTNFDPATLWQWGTMQAMAVIGILKNVEKKFGMEGQSVIYDSLHQIGYDIGRQITQGTTIPKDMTDSEWISFYATVINRIAYASLESPAIEDESRANFHIDWCPHQDHYGAMDCRVQRYFVQGMLDAAIEFMKTQGRTGNWDVMFKSTIPAGAETCYFHVEKNSAQAGARWEKYTKLLETKALRAAQAKPNNSPQG
ncbi:hypothetical protein LEP1GSC047_2092 [Leptospira inadai serovar Lyme str. 10]|uniref:L-2-amino-thiazoline-4-carboxylic acid hydrolase n=2 Tax=Leptospira inadai serovar Lyme TaxID=293084 RepID=V6HEB9_9LEPT|nr:hypothetical protein [Leptospira inadai]EQA38357.1 hypothetical protein LEP1GSC047_2092 [Leptospira inadai serovar Lyme str. 10]PNV71522.1 hypothetical protein BES34_021330 [Leptospira inadai serovar Lyme]